jgi:hypothetical protein
MTTIEVLEYTEAKDQIKSGRYAEALPKLYRLAGSYPQDQEIQDLIKFSLNIQQPPMPAPQPIYVPQPQPIYYTQPVYYQATQPKKPRIYTLYGIGVFLTVISLVLPWLKGNTFRTVGITEFSINFFGDVNGSLEDRLQIGFPAQPRLVNEMHGGILAIFVLILTVSFLIGVFIKNTPFNYYLLGLSLVGLIIFGYMLINLGRFSDIANTPAPNIQGYVAPVNISIGPLFGGLGILLILIGGIIIVRQPAKKFESNR